MFLKVFQLIRTIEPNIGKLQRVTQPVFNSDYISKRNAGHSEWANRKGVKEANALKKSLILTKLKMQLRAAILQEKNANPALNPKLQAVVAEAKKASIPQSTIDKLIKPYAASLNRENIMSFTFSHSLGINCVIEISSIHPVQAKIELSGVLKKYGFKHENNPVQPYTMVGIISGKKPENVENAYDKAVEDAIQANCEEVIENDDGNYNFLCDPKHVEACTKLLTDLGYQIDYSETQCQFPTYVNVDEAITARLEQMEDKLQNVPGFIKMSMNVK